MTVTFKDLKRKKNMLGQFMTPNDISSKIVDRSNYQGLIIEPSFGTGSFLKKLEQKYQSHTIIGLEIDHELFKQYKGSAKTFNQSFYQFSLPEDVQFDYISMPGNPPYRTPAWSLTNNDKSVVKSLITRYGLKGIKEEAVFFLAHAVDLIRFSGVPGEIEWVLPTTIFQNASKAFTNFRKFLKKFAPLVALEPIDEQYPDVSQPLCIAKMLINQPVTEDITDNFVLNQTITFQQIFKRTWLGSVPCESMLMSCKDEPLDSFKQRLENIFQKNQNIREGLKYNNNYHLRALRGDSAEEKFKILENYVKEIKTTINMNDFSNIEYYKTITHRTETRWYFRHKGLTTVSFIYIINSNPGPGFYFPGNPTKTSTDYFGYCDYDINRNSSPGANRMVLTKDIENNITDEFKEYWQNNTKRPIEDIFKYILHISQSTWYKNYKSQHQRFYFGLPNKFDNSWENLI